MASILEKIRQLIASSKISDVDQNDLLIFLPVFPDEILEDLYKLFQKDPRLVEDFNEDFKAKLNVLIDGRDQWERMIAKEEEMLRGEEGY
ncbi:hypothetical protein MYX07_02160 [Patescibacteria group bacterium AH-259-L07]|nr:hypothetical protein [Patescibacteria group bacterium AH-259-L07]